MLAMFRTSERSTSESDETGVCVRDGVELDFSGGGKVEDCEGDKELNGCKMGDGEAVQGEDGLL